jgi:hypothetical protein
MGHPECLFKPVLASKVNQIPPALVPKKGDDKNIAQVSFDRDLPIIKTI